MRRIKRALIFATAGALVGMGFIHPNSAGADQPGWAVVEASQDYCINQAIPCTDNAHAYNMGYSEVAAVNFEGYGAGRPDAVVLVCAKPFFDSSGVLHFLAGHVFAGPVALGYDGGTISGGYRITNGFESSTFSTGVLNTVVATDPMLGTTGTAVGLQNANNVTDAPIVNGMGMNITISGNLEVFSMEGPPSIRPNSSISCNTKAPYVIGPPAAFGQPPDSENVYSDSDGD